MISSYSCSKFSFDPREKFVGKWQIHATSNAGTEDWIMDITKASSSDGTILLYNLANTGQTYNATLTNSSFDIPTQHQYSGNGTISSNGNTLNFTYTSGNIAYYTRTCTGTK
jgi:hypothetical protein